MQTLNEIIENTKKALISITSKEINCVDDAEERDRDLDNLFGDFEFISQELQLNLQEITNARALAKLAKDLGESLSSKELEIGIAYASNQMS
jgi:hypothetical protein